MQNVRVAAVSMNSEMGKPETALEQITAWCERAAREKAHLVLFPELVVPGHCAPTTWDLGEAVPDGPSVTRLVALARQHGLFLTKIHYHAHGRNQPGIKILAHHIH